MKKKEECFHKELYLEEIDWMIDKYFLYSVDVDNISSKWMILILINGIKFGILTRQITVNYL